MIIDKFVEVVLQASNIKYYEKLGYIIPKYKDNVGIYRIKRNTTIIVKVLDLSKGSAVKIKCKCDICGKIRLVKYINYRDICHTCSARLMLSKFGKENYCWKGGLPKCVDCGKKLKFHNHKRCRSCWRNYIKKNPVKRKSGKDHPMYNPLLTDKERLYKRMLISGIQTWRKNILIKDNYTCRKCKKIGELHNGLLEAHHINNFRDFEELRLNINNGITLCKDCHKKIHKMFGKKTNKNHLDLFFKG